MKESEIIIAHFSELGIKDVSRVGGKNASLGEMFSNLSSRGVSVPEGFAITASGYRMFIRHNNIGDELNRIVGQLDANDLSNLREVGAKAREVIRNAVFPADLASEIVSAYRRLFGDQEGSVAVRSSATAEDLPSASFAGQMESFLNIRGDKQLIGYVHRCYESLYTDRSLKYRVDKGFSNLDIAVSVGVQKMVRSDKASSGVAFTLDPDSGFDKVVVINSIFGLGENIVQGRSTPDEFVVFKKHLDTSFDPVILQKCGGKEWTMVYGDTPDKPVVNLETVREKMSQMSVTRDTVLKLAKWCCIIEDHYERPMDIEWAVDGETGELFIIQARPETVHAGKEKRKSFVQYKLTSRGKILAEGIALGEKIASGKARILTHPSEGHLLQKGDVLITDITNPDWDPLMKKAGAIVTNKGGRTSHAAIVARELGIVAVVGSGNATEVIRDGDMVTVSCAEGKTGTIYEGKLNWEVQERSMEGMTDTRTAPLLILGDPSQAFALSALPARGVGLMRMEFLITHHIGLHPLALTRYDQLEKAEDRKLVDQLTNEYKSREEYFLDRLSRGVAMIAAAFHPNEVIVRMSDFKSNEYAGLPGGSQFEPQEENPMIGFRGASRYYSPMYEDGFGLECRAMKRVRDEFGFTNVKLMIPFCRTPEEGRKVIGVMKKYGLEQGVNGLEIYVMVEIPSNVLQAEEFAEIFDGFSIGSNDLTQLTLGLDRDSTLVSPLFSEKNNAVLSLIRSAIRTAKAKGIHIGLCGQAPSDMPDFARILVEEGIDSISFNPDALFKGIENIVQAEKGKE